MAVRRWRFTWLASQRSTSQPFSLGRATTVVQADGTSVTNTYWLTGELRKVTGSRVYPVEYTYDTMGRMATWRNFAGNSGAAVTTWLYDDRGRLQFKRYDDATEVFYQYTPGNRLKQRAWARYLYTTYEYDFEDTATARKTGDLVRVSYSDGVTPQVDYAYDRRGRRTGIEQRNSSSTLIGASTLGYHASGVLTSETHTIGPLNGLSLTLGYDSYLRRTNLTAKQSSTTVLLNRYGYDAASRLNLVGNGTSDVSYTYAANSFLADTVTSKQSGTTRLTTTRQYDFLNRLQSTWAQPGAAGTAPIGSAYQYNDANQRTRQQLGDASYWRYEYDSLGQVTSGRRYWSDGTPVLGQQFEYGFDDIGNRKTAKTGGDLNGANLRSQNYTANNLNLYTTQTNPRYLEVQGAAQASATVTVNSASVSRQGEYFRKELGPSSGTIAKWESVTVSVSGGSTTGTKYLSVPPSTVSPGYDADGNLLSDGLWTYAWDGENRLIEAASALDPNTAAPYTPTSLARRITYRYDGLGRLIERVEYPWTAGAWSGTPSATMRYLNDGWQCVVEFSYSGSTLAHQRSYVWGLDLSQSRTGAGGVGGLVAIYQAGAAYFPAYDGNGNVVGLVKGADGTVNGRYEYGPFGETLRATGDAVATANPWRFSTKRTDPVTGLAHYEYRVYSPINGRWLSRDPLGDEAFLKRLSKGKSPHVRTFLRQQAFMPNYTLAVNNAVNHFDVAGLAVPSVEQLVWQTGFTYPGYSCGCVMTLCEAIGRFIDVLADSVSDYDDFQEYLWKYKDQAGYLLARDYETITGCTHKREFGDLCCHGFKDNLRMNGADNLRHFAGGLYYGKTGSTLQTYLSDIPQQWWADDPGRRAESQAEIEANTQAGLSSNAIENQLGQNAPWYVEDEESDQAWAKTKMMVGAQWRSRFCKPQE